MIGIILAGGRSTRLGGGDKGLRTIGGLPILDRVIATMTRQCEGLVLNANGDPDRFSRYALPIVPDDVPDLPGPLAGILAGLDWVAAHRPEARAAVTVPTDAPFIPADFVERLLAAWSACPQGTIEATIACARSRGRLHPVATLWPVALRHDLRRALTEEGLRKVTVFLARHPLVTVDWPVEPIDPFFNANTPDDLAVAERVARDIAGASANLQAARSIVIRSDYWS